MQKTYIIYLISNLVNGKFYIGRTTTTIFKRWSVHKAYAKYKYFNKNKKRRSGCEYLGNAMGKYGVENFEIKQIDTPKSFKHMVFLEGFYIKYFNANNPKYGYNLIINKYGEGLEFINEETSRKISIGSHKTNRNNILGYRGIGHDSTTGHANKPWTCKIINNHKEYTKRFKTKEGAAENYDIYAFHSFGDDAVLNFPDNKDKYRNINYEEFLKFYLYRKPKQSNFNGVTRVRNGYQLVLKLPKEIKAKRLYLGIYSTEIEAAEKFDLYYFYYYRKIDKLNFPNKLNFNEELVRSELNEKIKSINKNNNFKKKTSPYFNVQKHNNLWRFFITIDGKIWGKSGFVSDKAAAIEFDKVRLYLGKNALNFPNLTESYSQHELKTAYENLMDRSRKHNNSNSKYRGVYKHRNRYVASLTLNKINVFRKTFINEVDAAIAYDQKSVELLGDRAILNFPNGDDSKPLVAQENKT